MEVEQYDNFILYALNVEVFEFINDFYDGNKDSYVMEKILLMRKNFGEFWCGLDKKNKLKYINLVKKYSENN